MWINGFNYMFTKHGRKRFIERVGPKKDNEMIATAVKGHPDYVFLWEPDWNNPTTGRRLKTTLYTNKHPNYLNLKKKEA